jgi:endonuclease/exonuclease/phosphatase family metal-dependent hydrolase
MSFNLWRGGAGGGLPLARSADVIVAACADCVGLQETAAREADGRHRDSGEELAALLGWHHVAQRNGTAVITRLKIVGVTPDRWGVRLRTATGRELQVFNAHLPDAPYQPYQLLGIRYSADPFLRTAAEAVKAAQATRGAEVASLLCEIRPALRSGPVLLTGDLNEPSHLDWSVAAAAAGRCPLAVRWPTTVALAGVGLVDAFRAVRPDEVSDRGDTWTTRTAPDDPSDRHDRIDFVFVAGASVLDARVVGEDARRADIVVHPYPSDHRAVAVSVELAAPPAG